MRNKAVIVTGGLGYIGSILCVKLLQEGATVLCIDDMSNNSVGYQEFMDSDLLDPKMKDRFFCFDTDLTSSDAADKLESWFRNVDYVFHLAGYKSVPESMEDPVKYFGNVQMMINLLRVMKDVKDVTGKDYPSFIFSSTAAVYGEANGAAYVGVTKENPSSPYGHSKLAAETVLRSFAASNEGQGLNYSILRYFNPIGALDDTFKDARYLESTNIIPSIVRAKRDGKPFKIFSSKLGNEGGLRDYVDVRELVDKHIVAAKLASEMKIKITSNVGRGIPVSTLKLFEILNDFIEDKIDFEFAPHRVGDPDIVLAGLNTDFGLKESEIHNEHKIDFGCEHLFYDTVRNVVENYGLLD